MRQKERLFHWKTNSEGLPDLAQLSIWRENTWRDKRPIRQINQKKRALRWSDARDTSKHCNVDIVDMGKKRKLENALKPGCVIEYSNGIRDI
ncbi:hypothetical protein TNCV_3883261 [Trichonephila clavipes]|nr:hypothetical protein TNCV_3883261 [Trichonephila clavipes]